MAFLKNAWYAAAWPSEVESEPLGRTFLGEPIVIFRDSQGDLTALSDRCTHRFAPLSLGKITTKGIRCPYHGLEFDGTGACVHNPHGKGLRPASLNLRSYPLMVQDGMIWIWMGAPEAAEGVLPPSYSYMVDPNLASVRGLLKVSAHYELVTDNLMDLSHVEFLHPFLGPEGSSAGIVYRAEQDGDEVAALHSMPDQPNTPLFQLLLGAHVTRINGHANTYWKAPANMRIDTYADALEPADAGRATLLQAHLLTPETDTSTHYFWCMSRDTCREDKELDGMIFAGIDGAFRNEDEPMIQAVAMRMENRELFELSPALLPMDEAVVRARRILARMIADERAQAA